MKILKVLESRNRCLKKIFEFSDNFLSQLNENDLSDFQAFEIWRNSAIKTLSLYDNYINTLTETLSSEEKNEKFKSSLRNMLEISKNYIYYIQTIDEKIIEKIEKEKASLLKSLAAAEQSKKSVAKFRSEIASKSGGQLDGKI